MSDVEGLLNAFSKGTLLRPSADVLNLVDLARALASLGGSPRIVPTPGSASIASMIGAAEHLVFVLVDGLGMNLLERLPSQAFLRQHLAAELRTVFPSTTAVALTSIATCQWPSRHAVTGWWTHLPELGSAATILPFVKRSDQKSLRYHGVAVEKAFPVPSVWGGLKRDTLSFFPARIARSIYSDYFCGGSARQGYGSLREAVNAVISRVNVAKRPTYTYLYINRIDDEAHRCGIHRPEVQAAVADTDRELERLAEGLGRRARVVIGADHGFLDASRTERHQIRPADSIMEYLRFPPSGDARVMWLHARDGAVEQVRRHFHQRSGDKFWLLTIEEAQGLGLFGPDAVTSAVRERLGDLVAISKGRNVIEYRAPGNSGRVMEEASQHSGLTPEEMRIPLIIA